MTTPAEFEQRFGVSAKSLRAYLRARWDHPHGASWVLTPEMLADACRHFGISAAAAAPSRSALLGSARSAKRPASAKRSVGLHRDLLELARSRGIPISEGRAVSWLSGRGHLDGLVQRQAPTPVIHVLAAIHHELGGDQAALRAKAPGRAPIPDLVHDQLGCIIEVDEVQHFTTARLASFGLYPSDAQLGFDRTEYVDLVRRWSSAGDRAFRHKVSADFSFPGGRQAQRAYNDALRDLLAPAFTGLPVIRIPAPDRSLVGAVDRLVFALDRLPGGPNSTGRK